MAEEDNFDIDIYGDENVQEEYHDEQGNNYNASWQGGDEGKPSASESHEASNPGTNGNASHSSTIKNEPMEVAPAAQPTPPPQGTKRKSAMEDLPSDPDATSSVQIIDLHWWITEDDVRGWCAKARCEGDIRDITFNEHKVNGKSKGQVYVEFASHGGATALKRQVDDIDPAKDPKRPTATYYQGASNPYKTLPKDNARRNDSRGSGSERTFNSNPNSNFSNSNNYSGGNSFRGGRGNFNSRGSGMGMGYNRGGFQQGGMNPIGNMGGGNMGMGMGYGMNNNFNNFNRGGMMGGMRGGMPNRGRGGMGGPMMNPMGGMGMGNMPMTGMGMPGGMMGMGGGFQAQPHFNAGFFQGQNQGGNEWGNPHGAKRPRPNE